MVAAPDFLMQVLWEGLVSGILYALIALGFVLIFRSSRIFNFAQGIMVVFAALTLVGLYAMGVPAWIAVLLIGREITVTGLRWVAASKGMVISANFGGKSKTAFQMIALILLILDWDWGPVDFHVLGMTALWAALILSLASGLSYFRQVWRQVNTP